MSQLNPIDVHGDCEESPVMSGSTSSSAPDVVAPSVRQQESPHDFTKVSGKRKRGQGYLDDTEKYQRPAKRFHALNLSEELSAFLNFPPQDNSHQDDDLSTTSSNNQEELLKSLILIHLTDYSAMWLIGDDLPLISMTHHVSVLGNNMFVHTLKFVVVGTDISYRLMFNCQRPEGVQEIPFYLSDDVVRSFGGMINDIRSN